LDRAEFVTNVLTGPAQMTPNAFIMNHWLYAALRASDIETVWSKYSNLKTSIQPDLETFAVLWDTAKLQYDPSRAVHAKNYPSARLLFADMTVWMENLSETKLATARGQFSNDLYEQIIRCFCLSSDLPGTLCALYGLRQSFGAYPGDNTTRIIIIQVARLLPPDPSHRPSGRKGSRRKISHQKQAMNRVAGIVETIAEQHGLKLVEKGINPEELDPSCQEAKQLRLDVLTEFLLSIMQRVKKPGGNVRNEVGLVAKVMGVDIGEIDFGCVDVKADGNGSSRIDPE